MRITRDQLWMEITHSMAKRSTCFRGNVGCIVVHKTNIVASTYNGPPAGQEHCLGNECPLIDGGCQRSTHAEINAIERIPHGMAKLTMYCTHSPCPDCADRIIRNKFRIVRFVYSSEYRIITGIIAMVQAGINVERLMPSGYLINKLDNSVRQVT